jgi:hypothetical protein
MIETQVPVTELEQLYTLRKADEVLKYIGENPFLIPLLKSAPEHIRQYFPGAPLTLELFVDFDNLSYRHLIIYIGTKYNADESLEHLYSLEEALWDILYLPGNAKITTNIEYL